jgi:phosphoribosylanthranilate isomerase
MRTQIKICGLSSFEMLHAAIDAGADAVGFVFAESPRRVTPDAAARMAESLPESIISVAVMRHPDRHEVEDIVRVLDPVFLQTDVEDFDRIELVGPCRPLPVFRAGRPVPEKLPRLLLFEGPVSGSGEVADWSQARKLAAKTRVILAGGLHPGNVAEAIRTVRPYGVDVSSGVELSRGKKDPGLIREFVEAVRDADRQKDFIGDVS